MSENLYFSAIIPPPEVSSQIVFFQKDFANRFNSSKSLKVIPHITLKAPFKAPSGYHEHVLKWFSIFKTTAKSFSQSIDGFGCFPNKRSPVIFLQPKMEESLSLLQKEFLQHFLAYFPKQLVVGFEYNFNPHITVAYRDLSPENFQLAWSEYKNKPFHASFVVDNFCLLQHDRKQWNIVAKYTLS